ncbi:hypothetical protein [Nocardia sp. NBC_01327]|uniref:hypothetical protein n=1 Tax=Nocardia sp. NBC_01327 TaxID=2903593 RepID=UPI002E0D7DB4|nr:hypothetical protein OG326_23955 [Nocardia sp. NBC_01327]
MRFNCAATVLASTLLIAGCGSSSTASGPTPPTTPASVSPVATTSQSADSQWAAPISTLCDLVTSVQAAGIFSVSVSAGDVSAIDVGTSEHEDPGLQCTYSAHETDPAHMVVVGMVGTGGEPDGLDSRGFFSKWAKEAEKAEHQTVPKLGDDAFCELAAGAHGPLPTLVVLAGQRVLDLTAFESADSCDTLARFAQTGLARLNG